MTFDCYPRSLLGTSIFPAYIHRSYCETQQFVQIIIATTGVTEGPVLIMKIIHITEVDFTPQKCLINMSITLRLNRHLQRALLCVGHRTQGWTLEPGCWV